MTRAPINPITVLLLVIMIMISATASLILYAIYTYSWPTDPQGKIVLHNIFTRLDKLDNDSARNYALIHEVIDNAVNASRQR